MTTQRRLSAASVAGFLTVLLLGTMAASAAAGAPGDTITITGRVYVDQNRNGTFDALDVGVGIAPLEVVDQDDVVVAGGSPGDGITDNDGRYTFTDVPAPDPSTVYRVRPVVDIVGSAFELLSPAAGVITINGPVAAGAMVDGQDFVLGRLGGALAVYLAPDGIDLYDPGTPRTLVPPTEATSLTAAIVSIGSEPVTDIGLSLSSTGTAAATLGSCTPAPSTIEPLAWSGPIAPTEQIRCSIEVPALGNGASTSITMFATGVGSSSSAPVASATIGWEVVTAAPVTATTTVPSSTSTAPSGGGLPRTGVSTWPLTPAIVLCALGLGLVATARSTRRAECGTRDGI